MCDVLFITPNMSGEMAGEVVGPLILSTILSEKKISCEILQFCRIGNVAQFDVFLDNALKILKEKKPKIISFYTRCDTYHIDIRLAQLIKEHLPGTYVVFGGPQSDITAEETIAQLPWVDFVCCGEGENTAYPLFSSLLKGEPDLSVDGLVYRRDGQVIKNPRPELIEDLDTIPVIDYSYFFYNEDDETARERGFPIDVGRGCPFGCTYCSTKTFWGRVFRLKSPQRICEEIRDIHNRFGMSRFVFSHDMFTVNRNKVIETCRLIRELDFPVRWSCSARLDCIDRELIDIMVDSGMVGIYIGIETGSPRMQKLINKNLKLDYALDIIGYMAEKGLSITASFIYGFPEETEEDLSETIAMMGQIMKLNSVKVQAHLCTFLMGTELSERYREEMTPVETYSDITGEFAIDECADLIEAYPNLFIHMLEYKTEFRTKLRFFKEFITTWYSMRPLYQYLSETYPRNRLVDMYYDFVEMNLKVLEQLDEIPRESRSDWLVCQDRMYERLAQNENYDIIQDLCRYYRTRNSEAVRNGENVSDIFCFDPGQIGKVPLQAYTRCIAMVNWQDRKRYTTVYPLSEC